ncbi:MAG: hypothetical protein RLY63_698 [Chloroflexota bacterium]|jgi:hypothetical protein
MAHIKTKSDEPPCESSGSGIPVTGRIASTTPMFKNAWPQIQTTIPVARSAPNVSGARRATRSPRMAITTKAPMTTAAPMKPNSSPTTAKM